MPYSFDFNFRLSLVPKLNGMFPAEMFIVGLTLLTAGGIFLSFLRKNKKLKGRHLQLIQMLQEEVGLHFSQLETRSKGLDRYHFLEYNLTEALLVQQNISID
jgi:hypothetical protein